MSQTYNFGHDDFIENKYINASSNVRVKYFTVWLNGYLESAIIIVHISFQLKDRGKEFYLPKKFLFDRSRWFGETDFDVEEFIY